MMKINYYCLLIFCYCFLFCWPQNGKTQTSPIPFVSDYYSAVPMLADSIPEMKLIATLGDSRWMHPKRIVTGDIRYAAHDSIIIIAGADYLTAWVADRGHLLWEYRFEHPPKRSNMTRSLIVARNKPWVMAANGGNGISIFNYYTGQLLKNYPNSDDFVFGNMSADGKWVAIFSLNKGCQIWNTETDELVYNIAAKVSALSFSPTQPQVAFSMPFENQNYQLVFFNLEKQIHTVDTLFKGDWRTCQQLAYDPSGRYLAAGFRQGKLLILDIENQRVEFERSGGNQFFMKGLSFSNSGDQLLMLGTANVGIWNRLDNTFETIKPSCNCWAWEGGAWSLDEQELLLVCRDEQRPRRVKIKDFCTDLYPSNFFYKQPSELAFSPNGRYLAAMPNNEGSIIFFDLLAKKKSHQLDPPPNTRGFTQIRFGHTGRYFAALPYSQEAVSIVYSFPKLQDKEIALLGNDIIFNDNDHSIVAISYGMGSIFDYRYQIYPISSKLSISDPQVIGEQFKKDANYLQKSLWQAHSSNLNHWLNRKVISLLPNPPAKWYSPASDELCEHRFGGFDLEKKRYAGGANNGIVYIYDAKTGEIIAGKSMQGVEVWTVAIHPNGTKVAVVGWDSLIRIYEVP